MLIALELVGFKSFADKTRFEFPDGITVIVGPNGSGKSNVVDAIKWVLGTQSAKSLRGAEMLDVIFKGSASSGRKPANSAEATLVFDNSEQRLPVDATEVRVTRRVYRSGEGEYLINGQACRLKDIKNLFRGTGVGVDAYSIIEQGKVDRMLQASPKERRLIFEEAAGISRFNAKKAEAQRRLQRVEQNLMRLKDIVDEVHARLKTLQSQASKAQRYREMTSRLEEIRLRLGHSQLRELEAREASAQQAIEELTGHLAREENELQEATRAAQTAEMNLHQVAGACQRVDNQLQEILQRLAVTRHQQDALRQRREESDEQRDRLAERAARTRARALELADELRLAHQELERAEAQFQQCREVEHRTRVVVERLRQEIQQTSERYESLRREHIDLLQASSSTRAELTKTKSLERELESLLNELTTQLEENRKLEQQARMTADRAAKRLQEIHRRNNEVRSELESTKADMEEHQQRIAELTERAITCKERLSATTQRLEILEELERHFEGVDAGARRLLELAQNSDDPMFRTIRGLVAEQFDVEVDFAPLVDVALGNRADAIVVTDDRLVKHLQQGKLELGGRLTLLPMSGLPARRFGERIDLDGVRGVLGRADRLVRHSEEMAPLIRYLLGTTWLVESLDVALELAHLRGAGLRFVTAACELIEADGSVTFGAIQSASGLVSRRSEIRIAHTEIEELREELQRVHGEIARANSRIETLSPRNARLEEEARQLAEELARQQASAQNAVAQLDALEAEGNLLKKKLDDTRKRQQSLQPVIAQAEQQLAEIAQRIGKIEHEIQQGKTERVQQTQRLEQQVEEETKAKIEVARAEQLLVAAKQVLEQKKASWTEREAAVTEALAELQRLDSRRDEIDLQILQLESQLADDFAARERIEAELTELAKEAAELRQQRTVTARRAEQLKQSVIQLQRQLHNAQTELERAREARRQLLHRYSEDYQLDETEIRKAAAVEDKQELERLSAEAAQLRADVASVGEINMAALAELDELQSRYDELNGQYEDLVAAKDSLQRIIQRINQDSRRMFLETLEIIRENFQRLYRKSFGGGTADLVLEEGCDPLEAGIDIIATPPGKTALSNSLLSGGEKALTAVALLLAIFQYRPSPFCVLDEVDAPFDEANIGRFVNVLKEFLDWTKFIIVTHSKKTMTAATTLYGVTMQESGISKRVAVRFEDVDDQGRIVTPSSRAA